MLRRRGNVVGYDCRAPARRIVGTHRTALACCPKTTKGWKAARVRSRLSHQHPVPVLRSGIPWQMLPQELGCGSGMTCWRRLHDWQRDGIWDLMHFALLNWLSHEGDI